MQLVFDILLIAIFALLVFRGWWRGFMKSILSLGRLILSLAITILFGSAFAAWIDAKFVNPPVFEAVFKKFSDVAAEITASAEGGIDALVEKIPDAFRGYLDLESVDPTAEINALVEEWSHTVGTGIWASWPSSPPSRPWISSWDWWSVSSAVPSPSSSSRSSSVPSWASSARASWLRAPSCSVSSAV